MTLREVSENLGKLAFDKRSNHVVWILSLGAHIPQVSVRTLSGRTGSANPEDLAILDSAVQEWRDVYNSTPVQQEAKAASDERMFTAGDQVVLQSGGPVMTVNRYLPDSIVECAYFYENDRFIAVEVSEKALLLVESHQDLVAVTSSPVEPSSSGSEPDPSSCAASQPAPINQQESKPWFYRKTTKYLKLSDGDGAGSVSVDFLLTQSYGRIPTDEMGTELSLTFFNGFGFGQINLDYEQIDQLRSLFY